MCIRDRNRAAKRRQAGWYPPVSPRGPQIPHGTAAVSYTHLDVYKRQTYYRRSEILKAYRNKYPTDAFIIYPDRKGYIGINAYDWLEDEKLYVYVSQDDELAAFTDFFMNTFATK